MSDLSPNSAAIVPTADNSSIPPTADPVTPCEASAVSNAGVSRTAHVTVISAAAARIAANDVTFDFQSGTIMCGQQPLTSVFKKTDTRALKIQLTCIATACHWYFRHTECAIDFTKVTSAMEGVVATVRAERQAFGSACCDCVFRTLDTAVTGSDCITVNLELRKVSTGMSVPVARLQTMVGRAKSVARITDCLVAPNARVLVYGVPGVGKDVVAAEVVHGDRIKYVRASCNRGVLL